MFQPLYKSFHTVKKADRLYIRQLSKLRSIYYKFNSLFVIEPWHEGCAVSPLGAGTGVPSIFIDISQLWPGLRSLVLGAVKALAKNTVQAHFAFGSSKRYARATGEDV
jgi:hypothetical protein